MKKLSIFIAAAALIGVAACGRYQKGGYVSGTTTIYCEEAFKNIMEEEVEVFEYQYPDASIIPYYVDEVTALKKLFSDSTQLAVLSRELTQDEVMTIKSKFNHTVRQECIAVDAVALITNKDNPIKELDIKDIEAIMRGEITSWKQLAQNDTSTIKIVFDNPGSATVTYMRDRFLPKGKTLADNKNAYAQKSNADVFDIVKNDKDALGIISVSWLGNDLQKAKSVPMKQRFNDYQNLNDTVRNELTTEVNILAVSNPTQDNNFSMQAYKPYQAYIFDGKYPLFRKLYMVSTAPYSTIGHSFYVFITGVIGQKIIATTGIVPYRMNQRVVNLETNEGS